MKGEAANPVIAAMGRRLRLGVVGGGPGSFIGPVHRTASRLDDRYEVVAAVLSSNPERSAAAGRALGLAEDRAYPDVDALFAGEADRADGIDVLAIMTPNHRHHPVAARALEAGWDVICDKPLTTTLDDAEDLVARVRTSGQVFCTTYNYTGYPMVRQAREMVRDGAIGDVRMVQVCYIQPHFAAPTEAERPGGTAWRLDPAQVGESMVLGDIGSHAHHLACFVAGRQVERVAADVGAVVPGRQVDDCAMALLRFEGGARGVFWVTNAAAGAEHGLYFRIFGEHGGLEWAQENPNYLRHMPLDAPVRLLARDGPGLGPAAARATRVEFGHPEGYQEAFAVLYADVADAVVARRTGTLADPLALDFPTVEDGARGIAFIAAAKQSARNDGAWTAVRHRF